MHQLTGVSYEYMTDLAEQPPQGIQSEAKVELASAPEFSPSAEVNHQNGEQAREDGRFDDAFANYYVALKQYAAQENHLQIAETHLGIGITHLRLSAMAEQAKDKTTSQHRLNLARMNMNMGLQIAQKHDDRVSAVIPRAYFRVADAQIKLLPKDKTALGLFTKAIEEREKRFPAGIAETGQYRYQYGDALCGADRIEEGIQALKQGQLEIEQNPNTIGGGEGDPNARYTWLVWNSGACMRLAARLAQADAKKPQAERTNEWHGYINKARFLVESIAKEFPTKTLRVTDLGEVEKELAALIA